MLCIIDNETMCLYEKCRYYIGKGCVLENIDRTGWPSPDERFKDDSKMKIGVHKKGNHARVRVK